MAARQTPETSPTWWSVRSPPQVVLPAICPGCLSPASRPIDVPVRDIDGWTGTPPHTPSDTGPSALTAYYCDLCADRLEATRTRIWGERIAAGLFGVAAATTLALALGSVDRLWQAVLTCAAAGVPAGFTWLNNRTRGDLALWADRRGSSVELLGLQKEYLQQLGPVEPVGPQRKPPPRPWRRTRPTTHIGGPVLLALGWLALLHATSTVPLVVLLGGHEPAVVTIDHRKRARVHPVPEERPGGGLRVDTLAGRRHLSLVSEQGHVLASKTATLWPGRTYLLAQPPKGTCFYLETQEYGQQGSAHFMQPLYGSGPLWELKRPIDRWFAPPKERADLPTTGGTRRALRLLPCQSGPLAEAKH